MDAAGRLDEEIGVVTDLVVFIQVEVIDTVHGVFVDDAGAGDHMADNDVLVGGGVGGLVDGCVLDRGRGRLVGGTLGNATRNPFQIRHGLRNNGYQEQG